jgi:hypothetical protein
MSVRKSDAGDSVTAAVPPMALWQLAMNLPFVMTVEALRFMGHRLSAQAEFLSDLAHASGTGTAVRSYRDFMESAASDYRTEAHALAKTAQEAMRA